MYKMRLNSGMMDSGLVVVVCIISSLIILTFSFLLFVDYEWCHVLFKNNTVNILSKVQTKTFFWAFWAPSCLGTNLLQNAFANISCYLLNSFIYMHRTWMNKKIQIQPIMIHMQRITRKWTVVFGFIYGLSKLLFLQQDLDTTELSFIIFWMLDFKLVGIFCFLIHGYL